MALNPVRQPSRLRQPSEKKKRHLTLLRRPAQHAWKRRALTPNTLHARIVLLPALKPSEPLGVLGLDLLDANDVGLQAPRLAVAAVGGESLALRIHRSRGFTIRIARCETLSSRLSATPNRIQLRGSCFMRTGSDTSCYLSLSLAPPLRPGTAIPWAEPMSVRSRSACPQSV